MLAQVLDTDDVMCLAKGRKAHANIRTIPHPPWEAPLRRRTKKAAAQLEPPIPLTN